MSIYTSILGPRFGVVNVQMAICTSAVPAACRPTTETHPRTGSHDPWLPAKTRRPNMANRKSAWCMLRSADVRWGTVREPAQIGMSAIRAAKIGFLEDCTAQVGLEQIALGKVGLFQVSFSGLRNKRATREVVQLIYSNGPAEWALQEEARSRATWANKRDELADNEFNRWSRCSSRAEYTSWLLRRIRRTVGPLA